VLIELPALSALVCIGLHSLYWSVLSASSSELFVLCNDENHEMDIQVRLNNFVKQISYTSGKDGAVTVVSSGDADLILVSPLFSRGFQSPKIDTVANEKSPRRPFPEIVAPIGWAIRAVLCTAMLESSYPLK
jgi:hypothetical protein